MAKYEVDQDVVCVDEDGGVEDQGVVKKFLGTDDLGEWYLVRVNGLDEEWHDSIMEPVQD